MELYIVTLTGTAFELRVSPNDTIMSIKSKIQRCEGIPVGQQHLIWKEDELFDHQSLQDCSIPGGATLRLVLGMRGGPISTYRPPPVATAAATIRFTPTVLFTASQKPSETHQESSDQDKPSTPLPQSSNVTEEAVTTSAASSDAASATAATTASVATSTTSDKQKEITFLFLNTTAAAALADRVDFVRVVGQQPQQEESTNSLLGSEKSPDPPPTTSPPPPPPVSAAQSLPFLQTEESALSCEQLPQSVSTTSEPSMLKAAASNDPATAILAGYVYAAAAAAAAAGGESDTDSDTAAAAYLLRPTSPEWDNRDLSVTPPVVAPPLEFPFFATSEEVDVEDEDDDDENDSLADLKDTLIYYQTGDVLFGPRGRGKRSASTASFLRGGGYGDVESSTSQQQSSSSSSRQLFLTQAKMEECESLAEKMRQIRAQLTQQKEKALRNRQRLGGEKTASHDPESSSPSSSDFHLPPLTSKDGKPHQPKICSLDGDQVVFPPPSDNKKTTVATTALPSSPHTRSHQHHIRRRPHTSTTTSSASAFDLSKAGCGGVSSSSSSASSSLDNLAASMAAVAPFLLPQFPTEPTRRLRSGFQSSYLSGHAAASSSSSNNNEMAPDKTTSETNLDAAAFIPGFGGGISYFSRSGRSLRQRRFGTVQPPDFSEISGGDDHHHRRSRHHHLRDFFTSFEATAADNDHEKATGSSLPHIFPPILPPSTHQPVSAASKTTPLLPVRPFTASLASSSGSSSSSTSAHPSADSLLMLLPHHSPPQQQQRGRSPTLKVKKETPREATATPTILPPIPRLLRGSVTQSSDCEDAKDSSIFWDAVAPPPQQQSSPPQPPPSSSSTSSPPKSRKDTSEPARPPPPKLKTNRCASCNRRTGLVDSYTCRCERNFCSKHRYAELHACPFDYKAEARRCIRESNPVVTAAKLPKI